MTPSKPGPNDPRSPETDPQQPMRKHDPVTDPNVDDDAERNEWQDDMDRPDPDLPAADEPTPLSDDRR